MPLPRFNIRQFELSHGLRIFVDGNHPTAVEVIESSPFWLTRLESAVENFGVYMQDHLGLVREIRSDRVASTKVVENLSRLVEEIRPSVATAKIAEKLTELLEELRRSNSRR